MRALLEWAWPTALDTRSSRSARTWAVAMHVILERDGGEFERTRRLGVARFEHAVRREIFKRGGQKPCLPIARRLFAALADPTGVTAHRAGVLQRVAFVLADWPTAAGKLADAEYRDEQRA
jgi:transposase